MIPRSNLYKGTVVSDTKTMEDVDKLLRKFGIAEQRLTKSIDGTRDFLEFIIRQESRPPIKVMVKIPFLEKKSGYSHREYDRPRSYRYFYHYLKALLSAKDTEMYSIEEIFMAHIVQPLPDGRETTLGEQLQLSIERGSAPALEGFNVIASDIRPKLELRKVESD